MVSLIHTINTKGIGNTLKRMGMIFKRYSFNGLMTSLSKMTEIIEKYDARITLPITAITLERNIDIIKEINSKSLEWAMHGYAHTDYTKLNPNIIENHIEKGIKIFKKANIEVVGFRAPYLRVSNNILSLLSKHGFSYDSSKCYFVDVVPPDKKNIKLILDYYQPLKTWSIKRSNGITEIPVSLPDDEILIDRFNYKNKKLGNIWVTMCEIITQKEFTPILQIHPERGGLCQEGLEMVLDWARKNDIKVLSLKDIAKGKYENVMAITGDIDVIKISDFRCMKRG